MNEIIEILAVVLAVSSFFLLGFYVHVYLTRCPTAINKIPANADRPNANNTKKPDSKLNDVFPKLKVSPAIPKPSTPVRINTTTPPIIGVFNILSLYKFVLSMIQMCRSLTRRIFNHRSHEVDRTSKQALYNLRLIFYL